MRLVPITIALAVLRHLLVPVPGPVLTPVLVPVLVLVPILVLMIVSFGSGCFCLLMHLIETTNFFFLLTRGAVHAGASVVGWEHCLEHGGGRKHLRVEVVAVVKVLDD